MHKLLPILLIITLATTSLIISIYNHEKTAFYAARNLGGVNNTSATTQLLEISQDDNSDEEDKKHNDTEDDDETKTSVFGLTTDNPDRELEIIEPGNALNTNPNQTQISSKAKQEFKPNPTLIHQLINQARANNNLSALQPNSQLQASATSKVNQIISTGNLSHTNSFDLILSAGYSYKKAGENLAANYFSESDLVNAWLNSPTHREVLLNADFQDMGLAYRCQVSLGEYTSTCVYVFHAGSSI